MVTLSSANTGAVTTAQNTATAGMAGVLTTAVAIDVIEGYATANNAGALSIAQLTAAGVTGAETDNLTAYKAAIVALAATDVDTTVKIQAVIDDVDTSVSTITDNNVLIIGDYAFKLDDAVIDSGYNMNNFITAAGTVYDIGGNHVYVGTKATAKVGVIIGTITTSAFIQLITELVNALIVNLGNLISCMI